MTWLDFHEVDFWYLITPNVDGFLRRLYHFIRLTHLEISALIKMLKNIKAGVGSETLGVLSHIWIKSFGVMLGLKVLVSY